MMPAEMEKAARGVAPPAASDSELTIYSSTGEAHRRRALEMLKTGPKHTLDFRRAGIMQSQTRIHELRRQGYDIPTVGRVTIHDDQGYPHRGVALYELVAEPVPGVGTMIVHNKATPAALVAPEAPPLAPATARLCRNGVWDLAVVACPFCGREHHHGGGSDETPTFGSRVAHCHTAGTTRTYQLVPTWGDMQ